MPDEALEGWIDDIDQPFVRLRLGRLEDPSPVVIDTGFNGQLLMSRILAIEAGFEISDSKQSVTLGDEQEQSLRRAHGTVDWFGIHRSVVAFVYEPSQSEKRRPSRPAKIGTQLLNDARLEIDFVARAVRISRSA